MKITKKSIKEAVEILSKSGVSKDTIELMERVSLNEIEKLNKLNKEENELKKRKKYAKLIVSKYLDEKILKNISFENNGAIRFFDKDQNKYRVYIISKTSILVEEVKDNILQYNTKTSNLSKKLIKILQETDYE